MTAREIEERRDELLARLDGTTDTEEREAICEALMALDHEEQPWLDQE